MKRYFFSAVNSDGENANAFIGAEDPQSAITLYHLWSAKVLSKIQTVFQLWQLPEISLSERSLDWYEDVHRYG